MVSPRRRTTCRACGHAGFAPVLSLGTQSLTSFPLPGQPTRRGPLEAVLCKRCKLFQMRWTYPGSWLYSWYGYRSGVNPIMVRALRDMAERVVELARPQPGTGWSKLCGMQWVLDIGSNDGTYLRMMPEGVGRVGFEPARNLQPQAREGLTLLVDDYFSVSPLRKWISGYGKAKVVTALAMFYDLDRPAAFLRDVARVLREDGVLVIQMTSASGIPQERVAALDEAAMLLSDSIGVSLREESAALRMTKIAAINEAGINIISTLDLLRLQKLVATSACLIMEAESCVIRLLDAATGKYAIRDFYGMKAESDQKDLFRMDKKAVTEVLKGASSILVRDVAEEEGWKEFAGIARTLLCLPLKSDGEIIGTVSIFDKFPHKTFYSTSFNNDDRGTFEKFIRYVEKAIGNAIAFERNDRLKNLDEATGLPTLKYFQGRLHHELSRAKRFKRRLVLMICEVTPKLTGREFAAVDRGEIVVKRLASVLRGSLREYDVVARISEWKFGMILPEAEDGRMSAIPRIKKAIHTEVEEIRKRIKDVRVDLRFGHASYPEDGDDHEKLIFKSNILKM